MIHDKKRERKKKLINVPNYVKLISIGNFIFFIKVRYYIYTYKYENH